MHVGVFPTGEALRTFGDRLPHACGGVSSMSDPLKMYTLSSPCMWGCFSLHHASRALRSVFPMHVGVFLLLNIHPKYRRSLPHACGGVSSFAY